MPRFNSLLNIYFILTICSCYSVSVTYAAGTVSDVYGSFKGVVTTEKNKRPIIDAEITITPFQLKSTTDSAGHFVFDSLPAGLYSVSITAAGFDTLDVPTVQIKSKKNVTQEFNLVESEIILSLDTIVVKARLPENSASAVNSTNHIGMYELNNTPAAFNDINRIIATTPSALLQSGSDFYSGAIVRGGNPAENVYMLDGFELENLDHFGAIQSSNGAVSFINTSLVKSLDFYTGAFPAEMSPALSAVTSIQFRQGMIERKHQIDLSILGLGLTTEGPFLKSKGSYLVSGRMVNTRFLKYFIKNMPVMPVWGDFLIKTSVQLNQNNNIGLIAVGASDQIHLYQKNGSFYCGTDGAMTYSQDLGGLSWQYSKDAIVNRLMISGRSFKTREYWDLDEAGSHQWGFKNIWDRDWQRYNLQIKDNLKVYFGDNQLNTGFSAERIWYRRFNRDDVSDNPIYQTIHIPKTSGDSIQTGDSSYTFMGYGNLPLESYYNQGDHYGGYFEYIREFYPFKFISGLRDDYYTMLHKHGLSPRLGIVVNPEKIGRFSLSGGLYHQFPSYLNNIITVDEFKPLISNHDLQRCWESSAGYERLLGNSHLLRAETYLKWYDKEFIYSTPEGPDLDSVQYNGAQNGKRKVVGCEFQFRKWSFNNFYYSFAYSLVNAEDRYTNGIWYGDKNSFRNVGSAILGTNFFKHHGFALQLVAREGQPYSDLNILKSEVQEPDGKIKTTYYASYPDKSKWNSKRRDPYVTLGIRYDFKVYRKWGSFTGYIDVANLLNDCPVVDETVNYETGKIDYHRAAGILPMFGLMVDF